MRADTRVAGVWLMLAALGPSNLGMAAESAGTQESEAIVVTGSAPPRRLTGLLGESVSSFEAPVQVKEFAPAVLAEPGMSRLSSIFARDASIGENYATSGYYENFSLRGFTLDRASAYRINGFAVPGEFHIPLDGMHSVEVLKGVGGLHGGQLSAGGMVNFITRRADDARSVRMDLTSTGGSLIAADYGRARSETGVAGFRLNLAHEEMRPDAKSANGSRDFASLALDISPTSGLKLLADVIVQSRSQPAIPGFQLLGGTAIPQGVDPRTNINQQSWSRPVRNDGHFGSLRAEWSLAPQTTLRFGYGQAQARIEDNLAFPWGCNDPPVQYFCANGDYVLYDYHAKERRQSDHASASLHTLANTDNLSHAMTLGVERIERSVKQKDFYSTTIYDALGRGLSGNLASPQLPLPAPPGAPVDRPSTSAQQNAAFLADRIAWSNLEALLGLRVVRTQQAPNGSEETWRLPMVALTWRAAPAQRIYLSRGDGVEFGTEAPLVAANAGTLMAPRRTRQIELGWKAQATRDSSYSAALFKMERPYELTEPFGTSWASLGDYRRAGREVHQGLEFSGQSGVARWLKLDGSLMWLRAQAQGSGIDAFDGVQLQNVPRVRSYLRATSAVPGFPQAELWAAWTHAGVRNARRDALARVPGYDLLDAGFSWHGRLGGRESTFSVVVRNLADRKYWRDVGEAYSADLLFPGTPRLAYAALRVSW